MTFWLDRRASTSSMARAETTTYAMPRTAAAHWMRRTRFPAAQADYIYGSGSIDGGSGNDSILASGMLTIAKGGSGNDTLRADSGATVDGGSGNDLVYSESGGATALYGGSGTDRVFNNSSIGRMDCGSATDDFFASGAPILLRYEVESVLS